MICPHCRATLLRKERTGERCSKCRRAFAYDPKSNRFELHDVKLKARIDQLSDNGQFYYTAPQLWYAAARKTLRADEGKGSGGGAIIVIVIGVGILVCGGVATEIEILGAGMFVTVLGVAALLLRRAGVFKTRVKPRIGAADFERDVVGQWNRAYGTPPPNLVRVDPLRKQAPPAQPTAAVLCFDPAIVTCLLANRVPERAQVLITGAPADIPPGMPIGLLHDASPAGYNYLRYTLATFHGRTVVDLGLKVRTILATKKPVKLREPKPDEPTMASLRSLGTLTDKELAWLADGWWSPLAAIRPAALIARVEAFGRHAGEGADPDRRAAAAVGFLTWPTS